ncbi:SIS domain-containing protein [Leifsonia poae]|uniref:SIS domain-containing protein n=1 Tax=Leifsonia poae TaxID=110933 RepID=UPI001CBD47F8|nr:SIS domain-containing protein [Leifsonia poae]
MNSDQYTRIITALQDSADVRPSIRAGALDGAVFVGSGDSLSSGLLASAFGHRALSSGDITWTGRLPAGAEIVVGISHSGTSGATVRALRLAREAGKRTIAITSNPDSPLAAEADELQLVPSLGIEEVVPVAGHLMLGLGVAAVCGVDTAEATNDLAHVIAAQRDVIDGAIQGLPASAPTGISLLTLPELRGAGDFWMLKLIEATGLTVRTVALEESGHVDYFIGPDAHLTLQLVGKDGSARFERLAVALESTGQTLQRVGLLRGDTGADIRGSLLFELAGAAVGTLVADAAAAKWGRPPFRGGAVNMDARHIKLDEEPAAV